MAPTFAKVNHKLVVENMQKKLWFHSKEHSGRVRPWPDCGDRAAPARQCGDHSCRGDHRGRAQHHQARVQGGGQTET